MTKYFDVRWRMEYSYDVYKKSQKFSNENRTKYTIFPTEAPDMTWASLWSSKDQIKS